MKTARKEGHSRFSIEGPATVGKNGPATFRSKFDLRKYQIYLRIYQISSEKISNYHLSKLGTVTLHVFTLSSSLSVTFTVTSPSKGRGGGGSHIGPEMCFGKKATYK